MGARARTSRWLGVLGAVAAVPAGAAAQEVERVAPAAPAPAEPAQSFGDGVDALPGGAHLAAAGPLAPGLALAVFGGYGYRGETLDDGDRHHRTEVELAASYRPSSWLAIAARFSGRYDAHRGGGRDSGWVGDPRLVVRATRPVGAVHLGAQLGVWAPGGDAPSVTTAAITPELLALASYAPEPWAIALHLGGRLDRSARSVDDPMSLSAADRLALGVSDGPAALLGAGGRIRTGLGELHAELTWDLLLGDDAPATSASPLRAAVGLRHALPAGLELGGRVEALLSQAPGVAALDPLAPIEPQVTALLGVTWRPPHDEVAAPRTVVVARPRPIKPAVARPPRLVVRVESNGGPVAGATITATVGEVARTATTDEAGTARLEELTPGLATIAVVLDGYRPAEAQTELVAGAEASAAVALERELPPGQLRGGVRSSRGKPIVARLAIAPLGRELDTGSAGEFELDLPPGDYEVTITAAGFKSQTRKIHIDENGVTILNVDLSR